MNIKNYQKNEFGKNGKKLILKGRAFQLMFNYLLKTKWISFYTELEDIMDVPQNPEWHPEGPVDYHTSLVANYAQELANKKYLYEDQRIVLVLSALCHDLAKAEFIQFEDGKVKSKGHERGSEKPTRSFLERINCPAKIINQVVGLCKNHMVHDMLTDKAIRNCLIGLLNMELIFLCYAFF